MCIQPKDEIKEPPAHIRRRINYKEHDKSMTEGPHKTQRGKFLLISPVTHIHVYILKI